MTPTTIATMTMTMLTMPIDRQWRRHSEDSQSRPNPAHSYLHTRLCHLSAHIYTNIYTHAYTHVCAGQQHTLGFTAFVTRSQLVVGPCNPWRGAARAASDAETGRAAGDAAELDRPDNAIPGARLRRSTGKD